MSDQRRRLTAEDIVARAARRHHFEEEEFSVHSLMERERQQTLMDKRKQQPFRQIDPNPKTYWSDPRIPTEVTAGEYARRLRSQFEKDLIAKQQSAQATRNGYLLIAFGIICFAACLIYKFWM